MAAPTTGPYGTPILDNFNRADGDPGANWSTITGYTRPSIVSQKLDATGVDRVAAWSTPTPAGDCEVWATPGGTGYIYLSACLPTVSLHNLYATEWRGSVPDLCLVKVVSNVQTYLTGGTSQGGYISPATAPFSLCRVGSTLSCWYWNGSAWLRSGEVVDTSLPGGGYLALELDNATLDDFGGGEIKLPDPICCAIDPPSIGELGIIVTIDATSEPNGVGGVTIATYNGPGSSPCSGDPVQQVNVAGVPYGCKLVIDGAKHTVTLVDSSGTESDGIAYLELPDDAGLDWLEISQTCNYATCVCASIDAPCSGGGNTTVQFETQYRRL